MARLFDNSEERMEAMLQSGRKIMREALDTYMPVAVFAGFSAGNDSSVVTDFACREFGAAAITVNTLVGMEKTRAHGRALAKRRGWQHLEKTAMPEGPPKKRKDGSPFDPAILPTGKWTDGATAYEEWCFNFGMPGPGQHPRMYQRLKERVFAAFKREAKAGKKKTDCVMIVTGVRHDESAIRAGYQRAIQKVGGTVWVNPFYWQGKSDFALYRDEYGLPSNPVTARLGFSGECLCGTMGQPSELIGVEEIEPETAQYIRGIEDTCQSLGLPCKWACEPPTKSKKNPLQLELFGDEPEFQPACVGCMRRRSA